VNFRTEPRASSISLGQYDSGVIVEVIDDDGGEWVKVRIGEPTGYMMRKFLTFGQDIVLVARSMSVKQLRVDADMWSDRWVGSQKKRADASGNRAYCDRRDRRGNVSRAAGKGNAYLHQDGLL
jgi:hypothetical protein